MMSFNKKAVYRNFSRPHVPTNEASQYEPSLQAPIRPPTGMQGQSFGHGNRGIGHHEVSPSKPEWYFGKGACDKQKQQLTDQSFIRRPLHSSDSLSNQDHALILPPEVEDLEKPILPSIPESSRIDIRNLSTRDERPHSYPVRGVADPILPTASSSSRFTIQNLGTTDEGLHSHPIRGVAMASPSIDEDTKSENRMTAICETKGDYVLMQGRRPSSDVIAERRRGGVFSLEALEKEFQKFPHPGIWKKNNKGNKDKPIAEPVIPAIRIVAPPEGDVEQVDKTLLSVDQAYKNLHRKSERENRSLKRLIPLAVLVAETESIDINNTQALVEALRSIIDDRQTLAKLVPLAVTISTDQGIDFDFDRLEELEQALDNILDEKQRAVFSAEYNKRAKTRLERRVRELEQKLSSLRRNDEKKDDDEEDYIR